MFGLARQDSFDLSDETLEWDFDALDTETPQSSPTQPPTKAGRHGVAVVAAVGVLAALTVLRGGQAETPAALLPAPHPEPAQEQVQPQPPPRGVRRSEAPERRRPAARGGRKADPAPSRRTAASPRKPVRPAIPRQTASPPPAPAPMPSTPAPHVPSAPTAPAGPGEFF